MSYYNVGIYGNYVISGYVSSLKADVNRSSRLTPHLLRCVHSCCIYTNEQVTSSSCLPSFLNEMYFVSVCNDVITNLSDDDGRVGVDGELCCFACP